MGHGVTSSAPKVFLAKTVKKCVPPAKTVTTATPFMANALTVTLAGLGTGKKTHTVQLYKKDMQTFSYFVVKTEPSSKLKT